MAINSSLSLNHISKDGEKMKKGIIIVTIALACVFTINVASVQAVPVLYATNGVGSIAIADNSMYDSDPTVGAIRAAGGFGDWTYNLTLGLTDPVIGSPTDPFMDILSANLTSNNGGELWISFMDDGFTYTGGLESAVGGTTGGTVDFETGVYAGSTYTVIGSLGPFSGPAFSGVTSGSTSLTYGDRLVLTAHLVHDSKALTTFDYQVKVPEPGTLMLFGSSLIGLAFFRRRK